MKQDGCGSSERSGVAGASQIEPFSFEPPEFSSVALPAALLVAQILFYHGDNIGPKSPEFDFGSLTPPNIGSLLPSQIQGDSKGGDSLAILNENTPVIRAPQIPTTDRQNFHEFAFDGAAPPWQFLVPGLIGLAHGYLLEIRKPDFIKKVIASQRVNLYPLEIQLEEKQVNFDKYKTSQTTSCSGGVETPDDRNYEALIRYTWLLEQADWKLGLLNRAYSEIVTEPFSIDPDRLSLIESVARGEREFPGMSELEVENLKTSPVGQVMILERTFQNTHSVTDIFKQLEELEKTIYGS